MSVVFFCFPTEHPEEGVVPEGRAEEPEENVGSTSLIVNEPPQPPKDFSESHVHVCEGSRCTVGLAYYQILGACAIYDNKRVISPSRIVCSTVHAYNFTSH